MESIHTDPVAPVLLGLTVITLLALLGRHIAKRLNQPSVLGELAFGMLIGNIGYWIGSDLISVLRESGAVFNAINLSLDAGVTLEQALKITLGDELADEMLPILSSSQGGKITDVIQIIDSFPELACSFCFLRLG